MNPEETSELIKKIRALDKSKLEEFKKHLICFSVEKVTCMVTGADYCRINNEDLMKLRSLAYSFVQ